MIYTTGTIAANGNTVTGNGTNFTAPGSLIRVGCTLIAMSTPVQVLQIISIDSATQLTVTPAANPALPAGTRYSILLSDSLSVDGLAQDIAETFTMYQRYMSGFADVMTASGDVTITINGRQVTVPGQNSLAKKDDPRLDTLDGKSGGQIKGGISLSMGDGAFSNPLILTAIPNAEGSMTQASVARFLDKTERVVINNRAVGNRPVTMYSTGGVICQAGLYAPSPSLTSYFLNYDNGPVSLWIDNSKIGAIQVASTSDRLLKSDVRYMEKTEPREDALSRVMRWQPATFKYKPRGIIPESETKLGFIANDLIDISPHCVKGEGLKEGFDPLSADGAYYLDDVAMIAELTRAVQALSIQNTKLREDIEELRLEIQKSE